MQDYDQERLKVLHEMGIHDVDLELTNLFLSFCVECKMTIREAEEALDRLKVSLKDQKVNFSQSQ